jgi:hypothetical protein
MDKKHIKLTIAGFIVLLIGLVGVSFAFFNYTKTGTANNVRTGRIYFNTSEGTALNITSMFPMTSTEAGNANLDSLTIGIVGDTNYQSGEEFEITLVDVNNTINGKEVPISFIATYEENTGETIGSSSATYFTSRNSKDATIYKLNTSGKVEEGKQVLVGYIDNGVNGINGTLTIKAYVDADRVSISDTYPSGPRYAISSNLTTNQVNRCVYYYAPINGTEAFCRGTGSITGPTGDPITFLEVLNDGYSSPQDINYLLNQGIIYLVEEYGTDDNWVNGRVVLTTTEWNSLTTNPIGFKVKVESNDGIWVTPQIDSCVGCKYLYHSVDIEDKSTYLFTTWNYAGEDNEGYMIPATPSVVTTGLYNNYLDLINTTGKNIFLGVKLNGNNQVTDVYVCGIKGNVPFCLKGSLWPTLGGTDTPAIYAANIRLLQSSSLYNNTCVSQYTDSNAEIPGEATSCFSQDLILGASSVGEVRTKEGNSMCATFYEGSFGCADNLNGG